MKEKRSLLAKAISMAAKSFENKFDMGGHPYILHCLRVMNKVDQNDEELMTSAVLHDLIEDCPDWTYNKLFEAGFSQRVCENVLTMTHKKDMSYDDYIKRISLSSDCVKIKLADLKDNSDISRLKGLSKKDFDRMEKYHKAYTYLSNL